MDDPDSQDIATETPAPDVFIPPSISPTHILAGESYTHHSSLPPILSTSPSTPHGPPSQPCVLGVDEAGRGPVLGPMVYGILYLPLPSHEPLLKTSHGFMDSKALTPSVRSNLMENLCTPDSPTRSSSPAQPSSLYNECGWATRVMSARDIGAGMLSPIRAYNLNAQAMDATIQLIKEVFERGVNVQEIYVDTIGQPKTYQQKLERVFPTTKIVVAKKADSIYPVVSAASVVAKVTRDAALESLYEAYRHSGGEEGMEGLEHGEAGWGSGYPSDKRCTEWMRGHMDEVFGWGNECRFSWGTAKEMLEREGKKVEWPEEEPDEEGQGMKVTDFFVGGGMGGMGGMEGGGDELACWFGRPAPEAVF